ncbi:hypothetical protein TRFO_22812 [Tritrichomonas foetus]|uniref:Uncharacterized protein n=1 Tax=Tritrichomonas foetus TaxID=1144522 RepID=A0A1J4KB29_9EUKA|nr:hypothetical protein TRFO_22812 [Tritrichomonas foetus]|eukprot:OHT08625.1 hypothetical protein TRFO_22812 [Tritrichomonas foetus]
MIYRSFGTSLGAEYSFSFPEEVPTPSIDDDTLVFVNGEGKPLSRFYNKQNDSLFSKFIQRFPSPSDYEDKSTYFHDVRCWYESFYLENPYLLPVPIGMFYRRPTKPHVMSSLEKVPGTYQNRIASKSFSISSTPLYPENYIVMIDAILNGGINNDGNFPIPGPHNKIIPKKNHYSIELPWNGQLIPQMPVPKLYKSYNDYLTAMKRWCRDISISKTVPMHSEELEKVIGVQLQPKTYESSDSDIQIEENKEIELNVQKAERNHLKSISHENYNIINNRKFSHGSDISLINKNSCVNLHDYKDIPFENESELNKKSLYGIQHIYEATFQMNLIKELPIHLSFPNDLEPCNTIYHSFSDFGVTEQMKEQAEAAGVFYSFDIDVFEWKGLGHLHVKFIKDLLELDEFRKSVGYRYSLFKSFCKLINDQENDLLCDVLFADLNTLHKIFLLFSEFTDKITYVPELLPIDEKDPNAAILQTIQHIFMFHCIYHQMAIFLSNNQFFVDRYATLSENLNYFLELHGPLFCQIFNECCIDNSGINNDDIINNDYLLNGQSKISELHLNLLLLVFASRSPKLPVFMTYFNPSIFVILSRISVNNPNIFPKFSTQLLWNSNTAILLFDHLASLRINPRNYLLNTSHQFFNFLTILTTVRVYETSPANDIRWPLFILPNIFMCYNSDNNEDLLNFSLAICDFMKKRLKQYPNMNSWDEYLDQLESVIFSTFSVIKIESHKIYLIKSLKKLVWHHSSEYVLKVDAFIKQLVTMLVCGDNDVSICTIRLFTTVITNHQFFLSNIISSPIQLQMVGGALEARSWPKILEIFKMIMKYISNNNDQFYMLQLLAAAKIKINILLSVAENTCPFKYIHILNKFKAFLDDKPNLKNYFLDSHKVRRLSGRNYP